MGKGKPNGYKAAGKLVQLRKKNYWKSKQNKRKLNPKIYKDPFYNSGYASGIVIEKLKGWRRTKNRTNNGFHSILRVRLLNGGKSVLAKVPYDGGLLYIDENDGVLLAKTQKGKNIGDIDVNGSSIKYKVISVQGISLHALVTEKKDKPRR